MVTTTTPEAVAELLDTDDPVTIVDTRDEESFDAWRMPGAHRVRFVPGDELTEDERERVAELADGGPIVTVCGKGIASAAFGAALSDAGFEDVRVMLGGMEGWAEVHERVPIPIDGAEVVQVQRRSTGCLGYVIGCPETGSAAVVDPTLQREAFKVAAVDAGLTIERVIDTHVHADHVSGGPRLAGELGVPYHMPAAARDRNVSREFEPVADGETIAVGEVEVTALHAPGHTSDLTAFRVGEEALLTADALFVDGVGRTELEFGDADAKEGAQMLYRTLHNVFLGEPDDQSVLPGHASVAADGTVSGGSFGAPIAVQLGDLRRELDLLDLDEEAFVERVTSGDSDKPANYEAIVAINSGRETVHDELELRRLEMGPNNCSA